MSASRITVVTRALGGAIAATMLAGVVAIAAEPTGAATPAGAVPSSSRLAADVNIDGVHVLLVSTSEDRYGVLVAYHGRKGWLAVHPSAAPAGTQAAWTVTGGAGPVPALAMAYGSVTTVSASVASVEVRWADGTTTEVRPHDDGSWLAVRSGQVSVSQVVLADAAGRAVSTVTAQ